MAPADSVSGQHLRRLAVAFLASSALLGLGLMVAAVAVVLASIVAALIGVIAILIGGSAIIALWRHHPTVFRKGWEQIITDGPGGTLRLALRFAQRATLVDLVSALRRRKARTTSIGSVGSKTCRPVTEPWMQIYRAWRAHTNVHLQAAGTPRQTDANSLITSGLFEPDHYRGQLAREYAAATTDELVRHYLSTGWQDNLEPSRGISPKVASHVLGIYDSEPLSEFLELREHTPPPVMPMTPGASDDQLRWSYLAGGAWSRTGVCLVRVIGNDLPPRHAAGQSKKNVRFILDHERLPPGVARHWVLNRITDCDVHTELLAVLESAGESVLQIPFVADEYRQVGFRFSDLGFAGLTWDLDFGLEQVEIARAWDHVYGDKNRYAMNNNGARNFALAVFRDAARWVLPWDGNTFLTESAWSDLLEALESEPWRPAFVVPMARVADNAALFGDDFVPVATEEPQLVFRSDIMVAFDESYRYGRRPKIELLLRLGVPGPWERWSKSDPWETPLPELAQPVGWRHASWVARLGSGESELEKSIHLRGTGRREAVRKHLHSLDVDLLKRYLTSHHLLVCDEGLLLKRKMRWLAGDEETSLLVNDLIQEAERVMLLPPPPRETLDSVQPLRSPADNVILALPWALPPRRALPDPSLGQTPLIRTDEHSPSNTRDSRGAVQRMFDETLLLALAATFSESIEHWHAAAERVRVWFIDPETRISPQLQYVRPQFRNRQNAEMSIEICNLQDIYLFLDAVYLLQNHKTHAFSRDDSEALRSWFTEYVSWLSESPQGRSERASARANGQRYDLQYAAISAWLGDYEALQATILRASERAAQHFRAGAAWNADIRLSLLNESPSYASDWQELSLAIDSLTGVHDFLGIDAPLGRLLDDVFVHTNRSSSVDTRRDPSRQHRIRFCIVCNDRVIVSNAAHRFLGLL